MKRALILRSAVLALAATGLLLAGACGNDDSADVEHGDEVDVDGADEFEEGDEEDGPPEVINVKGDPAVDPNRPVPPIRPPEGMTFKPRPDLPDSGGRLKLPTGPLSNVPLELSRMRDLYLLTREPIPTLNVASGSAGDRSSMEQRNRHRAAVEARMEALERLVNLGGRYVETVGEAEAESVPRYYYGYALTTLADRTPKGRADPMRSDAVPHLSAYLAAPDEAGEFIADAEFLIGTSLLKTGAGEGDELDAAIRHLVKASSLLQTAGRKSDAARATHFALTTLIQFGREQDALVAAGSMGAADADFGPQTRLIQRLLRRAALHPGAAMPDFEGLQDADGNPLSLAALRGKPVIVHLFQTARVDGKASASREVETVLAPLAREYRPKGLQLVGGCLDLRLTDEQIERIKANWEEWGIKDRLHDGSIEDVRSWCDAVGMDWPFHYDGKWTQNAVATHLGLDKSFGFLLDAEGKVVWRGAPPYTGLAEAVAELFGPK